MGKLVYPLSCNCRYCNAIAYRKTATYITNKKTKGVQVECVNCGARGGLFADKNNAWFGFCFGEPVLCTT